MGSRSARRRAAAGPAPARGTPTRRPAPSSRRPLACRTLAPQPDTPRAARSGPRREYGGGCRRLVAAAAAAVAAAALDGVLQGAAGGELRNRRRRDRHLLAGVARVHALALLAMLGRELAESREADVAAASQRLGHDLDEAFDRLLGVAPRKS